MHLLGTRAWLDDPRLAGAVRALAASDEGSRMLGELRQRRTRLAFRPAPTTAEAANANFAAIYVPMTNRLTMPWRAVASRPVEIPLPGGGTMTTRAPYSDAETASALVHEGQHRLQNSPVGRAVLRGLFVDPLASVGAGLREMVAHRRVDEPARAAFGRGLDRRLMRAEIEAYRVQALVDGQLGHQGRFTGTGGRYVGDDYVFEEIRPGYARAVRTQAAVGGGVGALVSAGAGFELYRRTRG